MDDRSKANLSRNEAALKRRERIIESAIACFVEKGFHQTSIRDIANKAEISLGNVYNHFKSKEALIEEIAEIESLELQELQPILLTPEDPMAAIMQFTEQYLKISENEINAILTVEITAEAIRNPAIGKRFTRNRDQLTKMIQKLISRGAKENVFDKSMANKESAELIIDMIEGVGFRAAFAGKKTSKAVKQNLQKMIRKSLI